MKHMATKIKAGLDRVHDYPFWVLLAGIYGGILLCLAGLIGGKSIADPGRATWFCRECYTAARSILTAGLLTAPVMDVIMHHDLPR